MTIFNPFRSDHDIYDLIKLILYHYSLLPSKSFYPCHLTISGKKINRINYINQHIRWSIEFLYVNDNIFPFIFNFIWSYILQIYFYPNLNSPFKSKLFWPCQSKKKRLIYNRLYKLTYIKSLVLNDICLFIQPYPMLHLKNLLNSTLTLHTLSIQVIFSLLITNQNKKLYFN